MSAQHPFLQTDFHIRWSDLAPHHVDTDIAAALHAARAQIDAISHAPLDHVTFANTFLALEEATEALGRAWGLVSHLDSVNNSPELRAAHNRMLPQVSEFYASIPLNGQLWRALQAFADSPQASTLDPISRRFVDETIAQFRLSGADLPPDKKQRFEHVQRELAEKTQKYAENDLDSTNAFELIVEDPARLAGLPESYREAARLEALAKGRGTPTHPAYRFTLKAPSYGPAIRYLDDADLRRQLWEGATTAASRDPHDNTPLVRDILALRREKAHLLGKSCFPDVVLERRMAKSGQRALEFVEDLFVRTKPAFDRENAELAAFVAEQTGKPLGPLDPWSQDYWSEKLRRARYDLDEEALRPYFPLPRVEAGLFALCEEIFGLTILQPAQQPDRWHPDVRFHQIHDRDTGQHLGSFYTDWFPRDSKRSGAWMNYLITGDRHPDRPRTPHLGLMCGNLNPPVGDQPALLTHRDVETVFHEFGHLLHHLLGEVPIKSLNGVNVAWDFVELPSQIMENWCWERPSLDRLARHFQSGEPIPEALFQKMRAARTFQGARQQMRQLLLGRLDLELHLHPERFIDGDIDAQLRTVLADYLAPSTQPPRFSYRRFGHLFSDPVGYAAGYYSYKWAEVLDADAFTRFQQEGLLSSKTGRAFRDAVLAKGNSQDPETLFLAFMGRPPDPEALLRRNGLLPS